jgi:hypothetical protein
VALAVLDVRVVVAGDDRDAGGAQRQAIEALAGVAELAGQREVGDVAGADDVVDALGVEVGHHVVERRGVVVAAAAGDQVHPPDPPLVQVVERARPVERQQVQVGAVRESHRSDLPPACRDRKRPWGDAPGVSRSGVAPRGGSAGHDPAEGAWRRALSSAAAVERGRWPPG